jgi:AmmeMemoRadiSam system protein B
MWAGRFYELRPERLRAQIENCFRHELGPGEVPTVVTDGPRQLCALVVPHAGYMFSGPPAAHAYAQLAQDGVPETVIIIGPNHHEPQAAGVSLMSEGVWRTPLGEVAVDTDVAMALRECTEVIEESLPGVEYEHSLEVQLPFLQYLYGDGFRLVPLSMLRQGATASAAVGQAFATVAAGRNVLLLATTDLSHHEPPAVAARMDRACIDRIAAMDPEGLLQVVQEQHISMCGAGPVAAVLAAARQLGATQCEILKYSTSGDILRDGGPGVGYVSAKIYP